MRAHPSVAAVIVTYNRLDKLKHSLHAIRQQGVISIVVVNNNSSDRTSTWLAEQHDNRLYVINLEENTGGSGGFHTGVKHAVQNTHADWVLCFDDDAYPSEDAIGQFQQHYSNTEADIVAAAVYSTTGTIPEMNRPVITMPTSLWRMLLYLARRENFVVRNQTYRALQPVEIDASSFVGIFIRSSAVREKFGYPRRDLFLYCDDLIYTFSARRNGARLVFDPRIRFTHDCEDQPERQYQQPWKVYYLTRNYTELYRICNARQYLWMSVARSIFIVSRIRHSSHKYLYLLNVMTGFRDGIRRDFSNHPA